mmetsp:Transcript_45919/g.146584  ORF Transcript_45919/g.146584 Transcript_45919/m.146584 type:complete len:213 (+) Transcript_45919:1130-1768(+)
MCSHPATAPTDNSTCCSRFHSPSRTPAMCITHLKKLIHTTTTKTRRRSEVGCAKVATSLRCSLKMLSRARERSMPAALASWNSYSFSTPSPSRSNASTRPVASIFPVIFAAPCRACFAISWLRCALPTAKLPSLLKLIRGDCASREETTPPPADVPPLEFSEGPGGEAAPSLISAPPMGNSRLPPAPGPGGEEGSSPPPRDPGTPWGTWGTC